MNRVLPHSLEAEQSVIGSMLIDREAISQAAEILHKEDFYEKQLGVYFEALTELFQEGREVDSVTLAEKLRLKEVPPELASNEYIGNLMAVVPTSANVRFYAEIVRDKAQLRSFIRTSEKLTEKCYLDKEPVEDIFDQAEKDLFGVLQQKQTGDMEPIHEIVVKALEGIEISAKNGGSVTGISTGFYDLDYKTAGLHPSELIIIAARPSMGKTAFVLNLAEYVAVRSGIPTAIFSLEMSKVQLVNRILSMHSRVDAQKLRVGNLDDGEWQELVSSARVIGDSALMIDDTPGISINELRSKCRKMKLEKGLQLIIIDYLQLMSGGTGNKNESQQQIISNISRSLKALARELDCPVIALSQLSRDVEKRDDKRPMLSDLRESGAIEQDADVVMFIYRDDYYHKDSDQQGISEIIIGKQRSGPVGTIKLGWQSELTRFVNLQK